MTSMKVANFNGCKVYNLTSEKSGPSFMTDAKKRELSKDDDYRRRVELIQDFDMATASQCIKMTPDHEHIIVTGGYPPMMRCYTVSDMSMKFQRGLTSDVIAFECLSNDYGKMAFLQSDRTVAFHAPYGIHHSVRVPKFGRDLVYGWENCDLYVASSGKEVYRINLEAGQFKEPLNLGFEGCNKVRMNAVNRLLAAGGEGGIVELWDVRAKKCAASQKVATTNADGVDVTALAWDTDGLTMGVGTSEDKKIVKIWERDEPNMGKVLTNIETSSDINALHVVSDQRGQSGLLFMAAEQSKVMNYFVPQLGPAPRWCSFLEGLTEELEEDANNTVYEDYKFVTKAEVVELGATALIGTPMLKGYMHGYFMEMKLYSKLRAVSKPFEYEEHRKKKIRDKIEEKRSSRIIAKKRIPKVNKELAEKMARTKGNSSKKAEDMDNKDSGDLALVDDRFSALFKREEFQQDRESWDYQLRNPTAARQRNEGNDGDSDDDLTDLTHMYTAVDESNGGSGGGGGDDDDDDDDESNSDVGYGGYGNEDEDDSYDNDNVDDDGAIIRASRKAAEKKLTKKREPGFYEISDTYAGTKSGVLGMDSKEALAAHKAEKERKSIPLADRVRKNKTKSGAEGGVRTVKSSSSKGFVKELSFIPKERGGKRE
eukprot:GSChrysophyteH2.ASY1.ANO1.549.1 assembled CDS